jgi:hypothetical protein
MLIVFMAGVASLLVCGLVASILADVFGILSEGGPPCRKLGIYITIAAAFGIVSTHQFGVADAITNFLVDVGAIGIGGRSTWAVYFAAFLISNVVTNNAAALIFPIAMDAAEQTGIDTPLWPYVDARRIGQFMSPFGYTTNLLIYGGRMQIQGFLVWYTDAACSLASFLSYLSRLSSHGISWLGTGPSLVIVCLWRLGIVSSIRDQIKARIAASRQKITPHPRVLKALGNTS